MPFDLTTSNFQVPENFNFEVEYEPSKVPDKKYVKIKDTDTYLNVVGNGFTTTSHANLPTLYGIPCKTNYLLMS